MGAAQLYWPLQFGLACLRNRMIATAASRYDLARLAEKSSGRRRAGGSHDRRRSRHQENGAANSAALQSDADPKLRRSRMGRLRDFRRPFKHGYKCAQRVSIVIRADVYIRLSAAPKRCSTRSEGAADQVPANLRHNKPPTSRARDQVSEFPVPAFGAPIASAPIQSEVFRPPSWSANSPTALRTAMEWSTHSRARGGGKPQIKLPGAATMKRSESGPNAVPGVKSTFRAIRRIITLSMRRPLRFSFAMIRRCTSTIVRT